MDQDSLMIQVESMLYAFIQRRDMFSKRSSQAE